MLHKERIFFTGATSGFGHFAACELANKGAQIIAIARNAIKGEQLLDYYREYYPAGKGTIEFIECDLTSFKSVKETCNLVKEKYKHLDQIILNAGVWNFQFKETEDGIEEIFQVNFLASYLIIEELKVCLLKSYEAKIILTSSALHQGTINFDDLEFRQKYSGIKAYRQSKLAVILLCKVMKDDLALKQIGVYCLHPGVVNTQLGRHANWFARTVFKLIGKSIEKGASTLLYLSNSPKNKLSSGSYYANSKKTRTTVQSYNMDLAEKLMLQAKKYIAAYL